MDTNQTTKLALHTTVSKQELYNNMLVNNADYYWEKAFLQTQFGSRILVKLVNLQLINGLFTHVNSIEEIQKILIEEFTQLTLTAHANRSAMGNWLNDDDITDEEIEVGHLAPIMNNSGSEFSTFIACIASSTATVVGRLRGTQNISTCTHIQAPQQAPYLIIYFNLYSGVDSHANYHMYGTTPLYVGL